MYKSVCILLSLLFIFIIYYCNNIEHLDNTTIINNIGSLYNQGILKKKNAVFDNINVANEINSENTKKLENIVSNEGDIDNLIVNNLEGNIIKGESLATETNYSKTNISGRYTSTKKPVCRFKYNKYEYLTSNPDQIHYLDRFTGNNQWACDDNEYITTINYQRNGDYGRWVVRCCKINDIPGEELYPPSADNKNDVSKPMYYIQDDGQYKENPGSLEKYKQTYVNAFMK